MHFNPEGMPYYSPLIGQGKHWQKVYLEGIFGGKVFGESYSNNTICAHTINIALETLETS